MTTEHQTQGENQSTAPTGGNSFSIPETYADRGWADKIKSTDDLWKGYDNAQTLIGKRPAGIPSNDASDADWDSFYRAMGRPDTPEYQLSDPDGLPEGFDTSSYKQLASEILHSAGLSPKQADKVYKLFMQKELEGAGKQQEQTAAQQKALDDEFDALTKEHFGDEYERASNLTKDAFGKYAPQSLRESLSEIGDKPKALAAVVATIKGMQSEIDRVKKEYGAEGSITTGSQTTSVGIDEVRKELAKLRISPAARDFTSAEHKATMERIQELSGTVDRYYKK
jgi:hypothetical protein